MKNVLIFVAGAALGALCLYAWHGYQFQRISMSATPSPISLEDALNRQSFRIEYGRPLRVEKLNTGERFTLTLTNAEDGRVRYSWRSMTDSESAGSGELFEKYEVVAKTPTGRHVKDDGGSLIIEFEDEKLQWSKASDSSGYIYYNPESLSLAYQVKD